MALLELSATQHYSFKIQWMPLQETHISKSKLQAIVQSIMDDEKKKAVALEDLARSNENIFFK